MAATHRAGTDNVILKPTKFSFGLGNEDITYLSQKNYYTYFDPQNTVGVGSEMGSLIPLKGKD